jgi:hypothetical protein
MRVVTGSIRKPQSQKSRRSIKKEKQSRFLFNLFDLFDFAVTIVFYNYARCTLLGGGVSVTGASTGSATGFDRRSLSLSKGHTVMQVASIGGF